MQCLEFFLYNQTWREKQFFKAQYCTYLVNIFPLVPTVQLTYIVTSLMDNSTTLGILKLGTLHGSQHYLLVPV